MTFVVRRSSFVVRRSSFETNVEKIKTLVNDGARTKS